MSHEYELLALSAPVGKGQENRPDDIAAFDQRLRRIGTYDPPPEYAHEPQRYATEPVIDALDRFQEKNGLKVDGIANPGGPTERAINNRLLNKPRGAGLMLDPPPPIGDNVGNGLANAARDVASVKRRLGALDYLPEDPFDTPSGIITEATTNGIKRFQLDNGLTSDGWMAPGGETERALDKAISDTARSESYNWLSYAERAARAQAKAPGENRSSHDFESALQDSGTEADENGDIVLAKGSPPGGPAPAPVQRPGQRNGPAPNQLIGINPNYRPRRGDSEPVQLPRDLEWGNPSARPSPPAWPVRTRTPNPPPARDWQPPTVQDIERALKQEPLPDPDKLTTYLPEPGSPLAIPIVDSNPHGRPGDPRTVALNLTVAKRIEKACKDVMEDANVTHYAGPGSVNKGEKAVNGSQGNSYPDFETQIVYKGMTIRIFGDTYSPKVDRSPNAREQRQFARLNVNAGIYDRIFVRLPKAWLLGEEIDPKKLGDFARELCREVKKVVDEGEVGDGKEKLRIEKIVKNLTKKKGPGVKASD